MDDTAIYNYLALASAAIVMPILFYYIFVRAPRYSKETIAQRTRQLIESGKGPVYLLFTYPNMDHDYKQNAHYYNRSVFEFTATGRIAYIDGGALIMEHCWWRTMVCSFSLYGNQMQVSDDVITWHRREIPAVRLSNRDFIDQTYVVIGINVGSYTAVDERLHLKDVAAIREATNAFLQAVRAIR